MTVLQTSEQWLLGEKLSTEEVTSSLQGDGDWFEIDVANGHAGFALVVWRMSDDQRSPACEARAALITAAPDLQRALLDILDGTPLDAFNRDDDGLAGRSGRDFAKRIDAARIALAKATGSAA